MRSFYQRTAATYQGPSRILTGVARGATRYKLGVNPGPETTHASLQQSIVSPFLRKLSTLRSPRVSTPGLYKIRD